MLIQLESTDVVEIVLKLRFCWEHCKYLNARFECNDIVSFIYSHYPLDPNAKLSDTKCFTCSIRWFCVRIERVMTVYENYSVIAFKSCIQKFTVSNCLQICNFYIFNSIESMLGIVSLTLLWRSSFAGMQKIKKYFGNNRPNICWLIFFHNLVLCRTSQIRYNHKFLYQ